ncbi:TadE family protein [Actinobacteria bacterium OK074]|nr:TadE family protein [Actinobacteria bacterium OK074]
MTRGAVGLERRTTDRGSAAVELVLVTPLLMLILLVVVGLGRLSDARIKVADAAHQAARAASLARTEAQARADAQTAARDALRSAHSACTHPQVAVATGGLMPGGSVSARVTCTADLADLAVTGMPGRIVVADTAHSGVDHYRSMP